MLVVPPQDIWRHLATCPFQGRERKPWFFFRMWANAYMEMEVRSWLQPCYDEHGKYLMWLTLPWCSILVHRPDDQHHSVTLLLYLQLQIADSLLCKWSVLWCPSTSSCHFSQVQWSPTCPGLHKNVYSWYDGSSWGQIIRGVSWYNSTDFSKSIIIYYLNWMAIFLLSC